MGVMDWLQVDTVLLFFSGYARATALTAAVLRITRFDT